MPASVRSNPEPSLTARPAARSGVLPGRMMVAGSWSYHRSQPAFARWKTRWGSASVVVVAEVDELAVARGAGDLGALERVDRRIVGLQRGDVRDRDARDLRPVTRPRRKSTSPCTSGISGMRHPPTRRLDARSVREHRPGARHPVVCWRGGYRVRADVRPCRLDGATGHAPDPFVQAVAVAPGEPPCRLESADVCRATSGVVLPRPACRCAFHGCRSPSIWAMYGLSRPRWLQPSLDVRSTER